MPCWVVVDGKEKLKLRGSRLFNLMDDQTVSGWRWFLNRLKIPGARLNRGLLDDVDEKQTSICMCRWWLVPIRTTSRSQLPWLQSSCWASSNHSLALFRSRCFGFYTTFSSVVSMTTCAKSHAAEVTCLNSLMLSVRSQDDTFRLENSCRLLGFDITSKCC